MSASKLKLIYRDGNDYYVLNKGELHNRRKKTVGVWEPDLKNGPRGGVYIRCFECLRILHVPYLSISSDGLSRPCIVCGEESYDNDEEEKSVKGGCGAHMWVSFKGWKKSLEEL